MHKYIITNAISDGNVLGFSVEYVGKYVERARDVIGADFATDIEVKGIDTKELLEDSKRLDKIAQYIMADWPRKTKNGKYTALFATPNIAVLKRYYEHLKQYKPDGFVMATIFSYAANEESATDVLDSDSFPDVTQNIDEHSRDFLERCIGEYNEQFGTNFGTDRFYDYYRDLQKRIKNREINLVLVVNMFLTGFDSKYLNTLYVDKNLKYHGLIQAYSRTNRLLDSDKPHGNIVSFRNLKIDTDKALQLYGDENAKEIVFKQPYEEVQKEFNEKLAQVLAVAPNLESIDSIKSEEEKREFVIAFRDLLRVKSSLEMHAEFSFDDIGIPEQQFYDYQSKYADMYEERKKNENQTESILTDIDFEIELTATIEINYDYIIQLIIGLKDIISKPAGKERVDEVLSKLDRDIKLRKKKDLIKKFITENLPTISKIADRQQVEKEFEQYWVKEKADYIDNISNDIGITSNNIKELIGEYLYTNRLPTSQEILDVIPTEKRPSILERKTVVDKIKDKIQSIIDLFEW